MGVVKNAVRGQDMEDLKLSRKVAKRLYGKDAQRLGGLEGLRVALSMNHLREDFTTKTEDKQDPQ